MSQIPSPLPSPIPADVPALPRAQFLTYVTRASTSAKVRAVVTWGLRSAALLYLLIAALLCAYLALLYYRGAVMTTFYTPYSASPPARTYLSPLPSFLFFYSPQLVCLGLLTVCGMVLLLAAGPAGRARKVACYSSLAALLPLMLFFLAIAVYLGLLALRLIILNNSNRLWLLLFLPSFLSSLVILLVKDLAAYTLWAANNPFTERPPVPFLPGRQPIASASAAAATPDFPAAGPDAYSALPLPLYPALQPAVTAPTAALPSALILSYVTGSTTTCKVRLVVTWGLRSVGFLCLFISIVCAAHLIERYFITPVTFYYGYPRRYAAYITRRVPISGNAILAFLFQYFPSALTCILLLPSAAILLLAAGPAGRSNRPACFFALAAFIPVMLALLGLATIAGLLAVYSLVAPAVDGDSTFLFLPALLAIPTALLLKDLAAYTLWAARNPFTEKPPTPFLPKHTAHNR